MQRLWTLSVTCLAVGATALVGPAFADTTIIEKRTHEEQRHTLEVVPQPPPKVVERTTVERVPVPQPPVVQERTTKTIISGDEDDLDDDEKEVDVEVEHEDD